MGRASWPKSVRLQLRYFCDGKWPNLRLAAESLAVAAQEVASDCGCDAVVHSGVEEGSCGTEMPKYETCFQF